MSDTHRTVEPDYEAVHRYVEANLEQTKRRQRRALWSLHCLLYVIVNLIIWIVVGSTGAANDPNAQILTILMTVAWGIGLFLHARTLRLESPKGERQLRARLAVQAMQNQTTGESPKLKREQIMRLADDGELAPDEQFDTELQYRARSGS